MRKLFIAAVALFFGAAAFSQTRVYLIPTIHRMHQENPRYTYDSLRSAVKRLHPDVIAIEIRSEDITADTAYLRNNYPYEMWMMRSWFPSATIEGFDWLGPELEGKSIPPRYWQDQSRIKALQKLLSTDSSYMARLTACRLYNDQRLPILKSQSLRGILQSNDAILIRAYYDCLIQHLRGSDYEELPRFYDERNAHIQQNVHALIEKHPGKTIVVLTGDDHYPYLRDFLLKQKVALSQP